MSRLQGAREVGVSQRCWKRKEVEGCCEARGRATAISRHPGDRELIQESYVNVIRLFPKVIKTFVSMKHKLLSGLSCKIMISNMPHVHCHYSQGGQQNYAKRLYINRVQVQTSVSGSIKSNRSSRGSSDIFSQSQKGGGNSKRKSSKRAQSIPPKESFKTSRSNESKSRQREPPFHPHAIHETVWH